MINILRSKRGYNFFTEERNMLNKIAHILILSLILFFMSVFMHCETPIATFELGQPFSLAYQETKSNTAEDITIKFDAVIGDSRCPADVVCVWEGNAEIQFTFTKGSASETFSLNTNLEPQAVDSMGYNIEMTALRPGQLVSTNPPAPEDYIASLIITKAVADKCKDNSQCDAGSYCAKEIGDCDGEGDCTVMPDACITAIWDPVCGCDGKTYGSPCEAEAAGVNIAFIGQCRDTSCDDGKPVICQVIVPIECGEFEILAAQNGCWVCVNPRTCLPWGQAQCEDDKDCASGYCDFCGTSSCPVCDDCVAACVEK